MARIDQNCLLAVAIVCLLTGCTGAQSGDQANAGGHSCCAEKAAPATKEASCCQDEAQTTVAAEVKAGQTAASVKPETAQAPKTTLAGAPKSAPADSH